MSDLGGLFVVLGLALLFIFLVLPMRPGRSVDRLIAEERSDYFHRRAQAYARGGTWLYPHRHALRLGSAALIVVGLGMLLI